jgi:hypothetical protein
MSMARKGRKYSEQALVTRCFGIVKSSPGVHACCEVPLLGRSADLAYILDGTLTTVEFKLRDWRKAIQQVQDHLLGADYCYVCMPRRRVSDAMRSELNRKGIGLLFFREDRQWPFEQVIEARRSEYTWEMARCWAVEYIYQNEGRVEWRRRKKARRPSIL